MSEDIEYGRTKEALKLLKEIQGLITYKDISREDMILLRDILNVLNIYPDTILDYPILDSNKFFTLQKFRLKERDMSYVSLGVNHPILDTYLEFNIDPNTRGMSIQTNSQYLWRKFNNIINSLEDKFDIAGVVSADVYFMYMLENNILFDKNPFNGEFLEKVEKAKVYTKSKKYNKNDFDFWYPCLDREYNVHI